MLKGTKHYVRRALESIVVRPLHRQLKQVIEQNDRLTGHVRQLAAHFNVALPSDGKGIERLVEKLVWDKLALIDYACQMMPMRTFADLGGAWCAYEGGYAFYTMEKYNVPSGTIVDGYATDALRAEVAEHPGLTFLNESFASAKVADRIGNVDVLYMFDVLYMQAKPTWKEVLAMYAPRARCVLISNVHFRDLAKTIRLMDLGRKDYFRYAPATEESHGYKDLFDNLDQMHPEYHCLYRDCHHFWQWGMTDGDLIDEMRRHGFRMHYYRTMFKREDIQEYAESRGFAFFRDDMELPASSHDD
jgi:hypothetical protein